MWLMMVNNDLVGGAITIVKNMSSSMGRMTSHIYGKINMFQTTNQVVMFKSMVSDIIQN